MNTTTALIRLSATTIGIASAAALAAPAAHAQRDLLPTGPESTSAPGTAWSDRADQITDDKIAISHGWTSSPTDRPTGTSRANGLATDIAYIVETRKTRYARSRIDLALELAANR